MIETGHAEDLFRTVVREEEVSKEFGFYWENMEQIFDQIRSECNEIKEASEKGNTAHLQEEIGDLIHATMSLAFFCGCDPYEALKISTHKYQRRLKLVMDLARQDGLENLKNQSVKTLMSYWDKAKAKLALEND